VKKILISIVLLFPALLVNAAESEFRYVSDELTIFMHTGPSNKYRIIGTVSAGDRIQVLETTTESDYIKVTDPSGRTGWVDSKLVTVSESLQYRVPQLEEQLATLKMELQARNEEVSALKQNLTALKDQTQILMQERDETVAANQQLSQQLATKDESTQMEWFWRGAVVLGAGILVGFIVPFLPRRKKQQERWM
jgi:SH3 domain protein